ncbi:HAD family hydrolase [Streptomyces flavofungini]|uniref:HAD family hydrolase n=1 Tax=Streptomyces flavofungini TaxID=68200 RepID=UPI0025B1F086|nr:haloacid dehalogenase-like hydrolase [Streptomyces flavofungini]WJV51540.1 haloacid dehalogenase-like hydrolase [Streptomyces flavofungini]
MKIKRPLAAAAVALAVAGTGLAVAGTGLTPTAQAAPASHRTAAKCPVLTVSQGWYGDNEQRLQRLLDTHGRCGDTYDKRHKPLAVFDWDNTVIKNDVGDATLFWMLRHGKVRAPERGDWRTTSRYLTAPAAKALARACPATGRTLPTRTHTACADEIAAVYGEGATTTGKAAFAGFDHRRMEPQYAWLAQLLRGLSPARVKDFAAAARTENLAAPIGAEQRVGSGKVTGWARYYDQQRDLIRTLKKAGFDVYVVSASPEPVAEVWARGVGLDARHTIGIRNVIHQGRLTARLKGCGSVEDGADSMITYIDGKRCAINERILGVRGKAAEQVQPAAKRQVFAAGDSDTDVSFLRDATGLRLVLNRNKTELMCRAYDNRDRRWLVNPMFIEPKGRQSAPYPCATTGYTERDGSQGPVRRSDGTVIKDQRDTVYGGSTTP